MISLRPHKHFNFVKYWKLGFKISSVLIIIALIGFITSTIVTGSPLTFGTEFSGGTSIQINDVGDITEDQLKDAFVSAANSLGYDTQISSIQTATTMSGGNGYIVKTTDTVSTDASEIMSYVENTLGIDDTKVEIETIGASWGASVIWSSILAFLLSCLAILIVIALRYKEPRMGVVALVCLFHDMIIILGIYAWAGMFFHMEITSDVIAALLAIIGYSLYDTVVVFHRISRNASPQMKCSITTCANESLNQVIVRSLNTSITSILPVFVMLILGSDTLLAFAFAMVCGMIVGLYSTLAISAPLYTKWKAKDPVYARLDEKYPYEVVQSPFTKEMMLAKRKEFIEQYKAEKAERKKANAEARKIEREAKEAERKAKREAEELKKQEERLKAAQLDNEKANTFINLESEDESSTIPELFNSNPNTEVDFEDLVVGAGIVAGAENADETITESLTGDVLESDACASEKPKGDQGEEASKETTDDTLEVTTSVSYSFAGSDDDASETATPKADKEQVSADESSDDADSQELTTDESIADKSVDDTALDEAQNSSEDADQEEPVSEDVGAESALIEEGQDEPEAIDDQEMPQTLTSDESEVEELIAEEDMAQSEDENEEEESSEEQ